MVVSVKFYLTLIAGYAILHLAGAQNCYECASLGLKDRWQLIGYPYRFEDEAKSFTVNCAGAQSATEKDDSGVKTPADPQTTCSSFCVTVAVSSQDTAGNVATSASYLTIRGCYDKLMGNSDRKAVTTLDATNNLKKETGQLLMYNNKSEETTLQLAVVACKLNLCNSDAVTAASVLCSDAETKAGTCTAPTKSQTCRATSSTKSGEQQGTHCTKYVTRINGWQTTIRGWSNANPFVPPGSSYPEGSTDKGWICGYYQNGQYMPPSGYSQVSSTTCYCNDNKDCNGGNRLGGLASPVLALLPAIVYPIWKVW